MFHIEIGLHAEIKDTIPGTMNRMGSACVITCSTMRLDYVLNI
jgi:hypothetical protein